MKKGLRLGLAADMVFNVMAVPHPYGPMTVDHVQEEKVNEQSDEDRDGIIEMYIQSYPLDRSAEIEVEWKIVNDKVKDCTTDMEMVAVVHDYLCETITYSKALGRSAHDIEGAILEKQAVYEGDALAFKYYMNRLNIPCYVVAGMGAGGPHAWNQVRIDQQWYILDATFDDLKESAKAGHEYFLVSENYLDKTHSWTKENYERCTDTSLDDMPWKWADRPLNGYRGKVYYPGIVINDSGYTAGIYTYDATTKQTSSSTVVEIDEWWTLNADGNMTKDGTTFDIVDGVLYYTTPKTIMKKDLKTNGAPDILKMD